MDVNKPKCVDCRLNCRYLGKLSDSELDEYSKNKRTILYKKGETIFKQSSFIAQVIFVREGLVKLTLEGENSKNHIVKIFKKHDYIGMPFLFGNNRAHFTAVVMKDTEVCMIEKEYLNNLIRTNRVLSLNIMRMYSEEFEDMYWRINVLGTKSLQGRLAETILYLNSPVFEHENIFSYITRRDLAELSAMSIESMLRLLNDFKSAGIVRQESKRIIIDDAEALKQISANT